MEALSESARLISGESSIRLLSNKANSDISGRRCRIKGIGFAMALPQLTVVGVQGALRCFMQSFPEYRFLSNI